MIRFVDIRDQGVGERFAFWCTVSDKFMLFQGEMAWNSFYEFIEVALESNFPDDQIERCRRLCPP